jgi:hypothetical protein
MKIAEEIQNYDSSKALVDESQIRGGKVTVADTTARDNIPLDKRKIGMFVTIGTATKRYSGTDVTNTNWTNANNWFSILDKEYGDTLYKRRGTELIIKNVVLSETATEIDVYSRTGIYMNGKYAFICVAYATVESVEKQINIEVRPVDSAKFEIVATEAVTATLFITYQEIIWDYEGVVTVGFLTPNTGYHIGGGANYGSIDPTFPYVEIGVSAGNKSVYWNNTGLMNVSGNIFAVEVNGTVITDIATYFSSLNLTRFTQATNPFPSVGSTCIVKVKVQ